MRIKVFLVVPLFCVCIHLHAQPDSFNAFRNQLKQGYGEFRKSVLDSYADYLAKVWKEYEVFRGMKRDDTPKPAVAPDTKTTPSGTPKETKPTVPPVKEKPRKEPVAPVPPPVQPSVPEISNNTVVDFYGISVKVPQLHTVDIDAMTSDEVSKAWSEYSLNGTKKIANSFVEKAGAMRLNDWFTYELVKKSVNKQCVTSNIESRALLQFFLLANMGFDVRLAKTEVEPALLIAIGEQLYNRPYLKIGDKRYYIYSADSSGQVSGKNMYTCELPDDAYSGRQLNMLITGGIYIGNGKKHNHTLSWNGMEVTADIDEGMIEMVRHYPQMDIPRYADSELDAGVRQNILNQLKPHISGMTKKAAANKLLHFVQFAFDYATDDELHGYEKPYFIEENFYYPKNDCEDRAIFYAFLIRNLLGLDVHLVHFPGHECTSVCFGTENVIGSGYRYEGKTYIICDPTYIGANIGQCMPQYEDVEPKVELW